MRTLGNQTTRLRKCLRKPSFFASWLRHILPFLAYNQLSGCKQMRIHGLCKRPHKRSLGGSNSRP